MRLVVALLLFMSVAQVNADKCTEYKTAHEAMSAAFDSLLLSTLDSATDSIAARLIVADSSESVTVVYDLRYSVGDASALIYRADAQALLQKRFWGLLAPKRSYLPRVRIEELYPYKSMNSFIDSLPKIDECPYSGSASRYGIFYSTVIGNSARECHCSVLEQCPASEMWISFFESNFYYEPMN